MLQEPLLEVHNIQGNILAGFNKDYQILVGLVITDVPDNKRWLALLKDHIATVSEVLHFNRLFKALKNKRGQDPKTLCAAWLNIAFSHPGISKLMSAAQADLLPDPAFRVGMPPRSISILGDPSDMQSPFHVSKWKVGAPDSVPDILLIAAGDTLDAAQRVVDDALRLLPTMGATVIYREIGNTRPDQPGHEHFGFKDGISQPAVRGKVSTAKNDYLTPRLLTKSDPNSHFYSQPGRTLIMPGEFVLGYSTQSSIDGSVTPTPALEAPWHKNGSFLVFRRLRQDVATFRQFMEAAQQALLAKMPGIKSEQVAAAFVGRWPNGAPIVRSANHSLDVMATDIAANAFMFANAMPRIKLTAGVQPDAQPSAPSDPLGLICPHWAHVRKVNPRDDVTDLGDGFDTLKRRMIRRGIPYGPSLPEDSSDDQIDRGLLFLSYQASIVNSFEKVTQDWANTTLNPQPNGHDPIIGQSSSPGRSRFVDFKRQEGEPISLPIDVEWVHPTGGGYFFAPSLEAIGNQLAVN